MHPLPHRSLAPRVLSLALLVLVGSSCQQVKDKVKDVLGEGNVNADPRWSQDSTVLAAQPRVLFRAFPTNNGTEIAPIAMIGPNGFRPIQMANRGWRAFDLQYFEVEQAVFPHRDGRSLSATQIKRGMWTGGGAPLDSIAGCQVIVPSAVAPLPEGTLLATSSVLAPIKPAAALSDAELREALQRTEKLVAPLKGIPMSLLPRYTRTVHQVNNGSGGRPTLIVVYNDPVERPDSSLDERPRQFIAFLDHQLYGYQATWTYSTIGDPKSLPRLRVLDHLDVNDDGLPEVLLGLLLIKEPLFTIVMKREGQAWLEAGRQARRRCQG